MCATQKKEKEKQNHNGYVRTKCGTTTRLDGLERLVCALSGELNRLGVDVMGDTQKGSGSNPFSCSRVHEKKKKRKGRRKRKTTNTIMMWEPSAGRRQD
jgi:hypothetical protein